MPAQHSAIHDSGAQGPAAPPADDLGTLDEDLPGHVEQTLADYLGIRVGECVDLDPGFAAAAREMTTFVLGGGKRIRPTFAWWGWRAAGGDAEGPRATAVLRAISALELIQACALVHDDLIDDSDTRRGRPTIHVGFADHHRTQRWRSSPAQFGTAAAVLLGDLALTWADDMLYAADLPDAALARAMQPWRAMRTEVLAGQYLDVLGQARGDEDPESALRIDTLKAASYTVQRPLEFGAEIAGADRDVLDALGRFGADIGVAFQLRDDLLGVFGDPGLTGKPAGDDLREGKRTVLVAEAFGRARGQDDHGALDVLTGALGDPELSEQRLHEVQDLLKRLGAVSAVEDRIEALTSSAVAALNSVDLPDEAARRLSELAITVTDRTA